MVGEEKADILAKMIAEMMALHQDIVEGRGKAQEGFIDSSEVSQAEGPFSKCL
jgi:hypothetical protein